MAIETVLEKALRFIAWEDFGMDRAANEWLSFEMNGK